MFAFWEEYIFLKVLSNKGHNMNGSRTIPVPLTADPEKIVKDLLSPLVVF